MISHVSKIECLLSSICHMPMTFGTVMKRLNNRVERSGAKMPDWLCLSDHTSKWNMDIYLAVDKEIPNADNIKRSGKC